MTTSIAIDSDLFQADSFSHNKNFCSLDENRSNSILSKSQKNHYKDERWNSNNILDSAKIDIPCFDVKYVYKKCHGEFSISQSSYLSLDINRLIEEISIQ